MKSARDTHWPPPFVCLLALVAGAFCSGSFAQTEPKEIASLPVNTTAIERIAFGSCAKHWQYQPIWETVIAEEPDLFLFLGDAIYADNDGLTAWDVTEQQLQGEWNRLADRFLSRQDFHVVPPRVIVRPPVVYPIR